MKHVKVYSADWCPYCQRAKALLNGKGVPFEEINVDHEPGLRERLVEQTGMRTIPQIFVGDHFVGGFSELSQMENAGDLDELLKD